MENLTTLMDKWKDVLILINSIDKSLFTIERDLHMAKLRNSFQKKFI